MKIKCPKCKGFQEADNESIKKKWEIVNGEKIQVVYYKCDNCEKINIIQLDNESTLKKLDEMSELLKYSSVCATYGSTPKKKKINRMRRINKKLINMRKELVDAYSDKYYVCLDGESVKLVVEMQEK